MSDNDIEKYLDDNYYRFYSIEYPYDEVVYLIPKKDYESIEDNVIILSR